VRKSFNTTLNPLCVNAFVSLSFSDVYLRSLANSVITVSISLSNFAYSPVNDKKNSNLRIEQYLGVTALALILIGGFYILKPFMTALMWSCILAFALWPVQRLITRWFRGRRTIAAICVALVVTLLLGGPMFLIIMGLKDDAAALGTNTRQWIEMIPEKPPEFIDKLPLDTKEISETWTESVVAIKTTINRANQVANEAPPKAKIVVVNGELSEAPSPAPLDLTLPALTPTGPLEKEPSRIPEILGRLLAWANSWLPGATLAVGKGLVQFLLSILLTFFILRDGQALGARLAVAALRIAGPKGQHLMKVAGSTVRGVVYGIIGTALAQGILAGIGFGLAGVPAAALLGVLTFFLSAIPIGPPTVWIPAAVWLFSKGDNGWAIFILVWGIFVVSGVDNIIKPYLISHGAKIPFIVVFMGVLGGALAFGLVGVFLGPTLLAVAYRLIEEWSSANALLAEESVIITLDAPTEFPAAKEAEA
jgi:predicted PurR-regulated permease PerM